MLASNSRIKRALIICDIQPDILPSLFATSPSQREAFLHAVQSVLLAATSSSLAVDNSLILFTGLQFPSRYEGLHPNHCLYGSLRRLNEMVGDDAAHWFMESHSGSDIDASLLALATKKDDNDDDVHDTNDRYRIIWRRTGHLPPQTLIEQLEQHSITDATVIGAKASQTVQATVQHIAEYRPSIDLSVVREAIGDDTQDRCDAMLEYLLPLYARVASLEEYVAATCGLERYSQKYSNMQQQQMASKHVKYYVDCERGGHYSLFLHHLIHHGEEKKSANSSCWHKYPRQKWYEDVMLSGKQYYCPLGKRVVDFCDEPAFSVISMFLKGRDCLDDKGKLVKLARDYLPETYVIKGSDISTNNSQDSIDKLQSSASGPWFVKETNKNGGRAVMVCQTAEDAMALTSNPKEAYVIQRHVSNPSLFKDNGGTKWHLKVYNLLACDANGNHWTLHCHNEPFLCVASKPWSANDLSPEAQITIRRTKRVRTCDDNCTNMNELVSNSVSVFNKDIFQRCTTILSTVVQQAIENNKLQGRDDKAQFEIFSADFMFDTDMNAYLIEFNFSPVLFDPLSNQDLTTKGLQAYMKEYELFGEDAEINDHDMIKDAVSMIFYSNEAFGKNHVGGWEYVDTFDQAQIT